ncbi:hypothetical protein [Delftia acidovorans]|uniref:hypothetical protein n=1 Tax=Delftia acidovorans TaxID=80866 RepID=UPI00242FF6F7|nr:hypothetical protein [Delftia acidovorans]
MKKKISMLLVGVLVCGGAMAQNTDWVKIGEAKDVDLFLNRNAYEFSRLNNGKAIFGTVVQWRVKSTSKSEFYKDYVLEEDCRRGYGKMYGYDFSDRFTGFVEWVKDSETLGSSVAESLCTVASWNKSKIQ